MINMVMLVGRLVQDPEVVETDNGKKLSHITLAINRKFKGVDGVYHTDYIDCILWNNYAKNTEEYCIKGDLVGIRGRLQSDTYEKDGIKRKKTQVIAENITFLSSLKNKDNLECENDLENVEKSEKN